MNRCKRQVDVVTTTWMPPAGMTPDTVNRSLASAAVTTDFYKRTCLFHGRSYIAQGDTLARHTGGLTVNALNVTTTVRNHTLVNIVLDTESPIQSQHRREIPETTCFEAANAVRQRPIDTEITALPVNEDRILRYNKAHGGYQHWLSSSVLERRAAPKRATAKVSRIWGWPGRGHAIPGGSNNRIFDRLHTRGQASDRRLPRCCLYLR